MPAFSVIADSFCGPCWAAAETVNAARTKGMHFMGGIIRSWKAKCPARGPGIELKAKPELLLGFFLLGFSLLLFLGNLLLFLLGGRGGRSGGGRLGLFLLGVSGEGAGGGEGGGDQGGQELVHLNRPFES